MSGQIADNSFQATKVAVLGAAGGIGQPLSLLLKLNSRVSDLSLYDIRGAPGTFDSIQRKGNREVSAANKMSGKQVLLLISAMSTPTAPSMATTPLPRVSRMLLLVPRLLSFPPVSLVSPA